LGGSNPRAGIYSPTNPNGVGVPPVSPNGSSGSSNPNLSEPVTPLPGAITPNNPTGAQLGFPESTNNPPPAAPAPTGAAGSAGETGSPTR
jgi:hypothetical protein